jgi:UDP-4-amino-4,6-dideoxy-N-acetyl-beta-L-altrosamine transaminase
LSLAPPFLPYGRHVIDEDDLAAVAEVLRGDWLTTGPTVERFESALAVVTGAPHALVCDNGTAALYLAARALGLGPGDAVVVPTLTFLATATGPHLAGAEVVFADVDPETGLLRPRDLEEALERARRPVRLAFPVHLNGQCCDMEGLAEVARQHGLALVEDACHALGGTQGRDDPMPVGGCRWSAAACFSFHPVKTIAMGEGGAVTTRDRTLATRLGELRNHGMTRDPGKFSEPGQAFAATGEPNPWYYELHEPSFNFRASDLHCALGLAQLQKLDRFVARRRELVACYDALLADLTPLVRPVGRAGQGAPTWHLQVVLVDFGRAGIDRAAVIRRLRDNGIGTQVHYLPVHRQPYWRRRLGELHLPGADAYYARCLTLPLFPAMGEHDVERVVKGLRSALET